MCYAVDVWWAAAPKLPAACLFVAAGMARHPRLWCRSSYCQCAAVECTHPRENLQSALSTQRLMMLLSSPRWRSVILLGTQWQGCGWSGGMFMAVVISPCTMWTRFHRVCVLAARFVPKEAEWRLLVPPLQRGVPAGWSYRRWCEPQSVREGVSVELLHKEASGDTCVVQFVLVCAS